MTLEDANAKAQIWWGLRGKAEIASISPFPLLNPIPNYKIGRTTLNAALGGPMLEVIASSRISFEDAFGKAYAEGWGPDDEYDEQEDGAIGY